MRRIWVPPEDFDGPELVLADRAARRLVEVLRLREGAEVSVFDGAGHERRARLVEAGRRRAVLALGDAIEALAEPPVPVMLCCAFPRGDRGDWVIEKATELGAHAFTVLDSRRAVLHPGAGRRERWRRVAIEAAEQCGRAVVPAILDASPAEATVLVADPLATMTPREAIAGVHPDASAIAIYIGPEGGWSDEERAAFEGEGARFFTLGPRVLRAETAAITALTLVLDAVEGHGAPQGR